jgi:N-acetylornithine carbamoyltransferase
MTARHLLSLRDLTADQWQELLGSAEHLATREQGAGSPRPLQGKRLGMLLMAPSLRTRTTFELACLELGAHCVHLPAGNGMWGIEHRDGVVMDGVAAEHVREAVGVLGRMLDGIGLRCFAGLKDAEHDARDPLLHAFAEVSPIPVLSLESAMDHPHQGLADALTVRRRKAGRKVKTTVIWAPHVKALPLAVPQAAVTAFAREGHEVVVAHPEGFDLDEGVLADAREFAAAAGGSLRVTQDRKDALRDAEVVYAKSWGARRDYTDKDAASAARSMHADWMITPPDMARGKDALFMHCLPVRRGVVVADEVLDSPASIVLDQAAARLDVQKATLLHCIGDAS